MLAIALLRAGAEMEGDGFAFLGNGRVTTFPRAFHLTNGFEPALPQVAEDVGRLPCIHGQAGARIWAWHPDRNGYAWEVRTGDVGTIFIVDANHGGQTRVTDLSAVDVTRHLVERAVAPGPGGGWLRQITKVVDGAACRRLTLGDGGRGAAMVLDAVSAA